MTTAFAWWNPDWKSRFVVEITSNYPVKDYQVLLTLDTQTPISEGKMAYNCEDIRVVDENDKKLLPFFIQDCNSPETKIWIKTDVPEKKKIYVYFNNPKCKESVTNPQDVFIVADTFDLSQLNTSIWQIQKTTSDTYTIQDGVLTVTDDSTDGVDFSIRSLKVFPEATRIIATFRRDSDFSGQSSTERIALGMLGDSGYALIQFLYNNPYFTAEVYRASDRTKETVTWDFGMAKGTSYDVEIIRLTDDYYRFIINGIRQEIKPLKISGNWSAYFTVSGATASLFDIYVTKYIEPEPEAVVKKEERASFFTEYGTYIIVVGVVIASGLLLVNLLGGRE